MNNYWRERERVDAAPCGEGKHRIPSTCSRGGKSRPRQASKSKRHVFGNLEDRARPVVASLLFYCKVPPCVVLFLTVPSSISRDPPPLAKQETSKHDTACTYQLLYVTDAVNDPDRTARCKSVAFVFRRIRSTAVQWEKQRKSSMVWYSSQ